VAGMVKGLHVHRCFLHAPMPILPRPMKPTIGGATMLPVGDELEFREVTAEWP